MSTPIIYISGGLLGDFIHQLSVINEKYLETGRKGVLYISASVGDTFRFGVELTYSDTYAFISKQAYIEDYKIHRGEAFDVNLSSWRASPLLFRANYSVIFKNEHDVHWGSHPWLTIDPSLPVPAHVEGKVLFSCSTTDHRYPTIEFNKPFDKYGKDNIVFITQNKHEYDTFVNKTGIRLSLYIPYTLQELVACIAKSQLYIGNLSSPLTFAYALHKPNITLLRAGNGDNLHIFGLDTILPCTIL